jgi:hypothetical protein
MKRPVVYWVILVIRTLRGHIVNMHSADQDKSFQHLGLTWPEANVVVLSPFMTTILSSVTYARPVANAVCSSTKLDDHGGLAKDECAV